MKIEELVQYFPRLYHMAEPDTWASIQEHGLLSTTALLDLFEVSGERRRVIEQERRPESVCITHLKYGRAVIRDQKPMSEKALLKCLQGGITPSQWFKTLNNRVFFWLDEERLNKLICARAYRNHKHCILTVSTEELLSRHKNAVTLSPINSGSTIYTPQLRGAETFMTIANYPFAERRMSRSVANSIVELVVNYAVPDISDFVLQVDEREAASVLQIIYQR